MTHLVILATTQYDLDGFFIFRDVRSPELMRLRSKTAVSDLLQGSVDIDDRGARHGGRSMIFTIPTTTRDLQMRLNRIHETHAELKLSTHEGVFSVVRRDWDLTPNESTLQFTVREKIANGG